MLHYCSNDYIHHCRQKYPNDQFWRISNEFTRQKSVWLQNPIVQRRYPDPTREKSAYLSDKSDAHYFPFITKNIALEARKITRKEEHRVSTRSRKKSAKQRNQLLQSVLQSTDSLNNSKKVTLFNLLADDIDDRLLYFISVYLTSKKVFYQLTWLGRVSAILSSHSSTLISFHCCLPNWR